MMTMATKIQRLKTKLKEWQDSPFKFIKDTWGLTQQRKGKPFVKGKHLTWQQVEIIQAVERALKGKAQKRISIASGHGVGKTSTLAMLIIWYLFTHKEAQVPCTAPSSEQMHDVLWKELAKWMNKLPDPIKAHFDWTRGYLRITDSPETWFARAKTARKESPEALAGVHGDWVLMVVDEASGVPQEIFNTAEGALTQENVLVLMISNPTRLLGYFYDSFHSDKHNWQKLQFSSLDSPLVDNSYVERIKEKHGELSDEFRIRVRGEFPAEDAIDSKGFVPLLLEKDLRFSEFEHWQGKKWLGVDPAGEGKNKTVWVLRDNFKAKVLRKEATSNVKDIAQKTLTLMFEHDVEAGLVVVDNFGVGANISSELAFAGHRITAINVGDKPKDKETYLNLRAEMYWQSREWLRTGGELLGIDKWDDLLTVKYKRNLRGLVQIMSKDDMRRDGIQSPDCFIAGTRVLTPDGEKNIECFKEGDKVKTPFGVRKVIKTWEVETDKLTEVKLSNGSSLKGKGKHKIYTKRGFIALDELVLTDIIETSNLLSSLLWKTKSLLFTRARNIGFLQMADTIMQTNTMEEATRQERRKHCIARFGKIIMEKFQLTAIYTIKMVIHTITRLRIWNVLMELNTCPITQRQASGLEVREIKNSLGKCGLKQKNGIEAEREENGIVNMEKKSGKIEKLLKKNVYIAENSLRQVLKEQGFVLGSVILIISFIQKFIIQMKELVCFVRRSLWQIGIGIQNVVVESVEQSIDLNTKVYNLTLDRDNAYYANGVLVNNCADALMLTFYPKISSIVELSPDIRRYIQEVDDYSYEEWT